jgi:hypothetical protein
MGEAKRRRAAGIGSRTVARREREEAERKAKFDAWWATLSEQEQTEYRKRKADAEKKAAQTLAMAASVAMSGVTR